MKKILLAAVFAVAGLTASAQTEQGKMTLGGTASYNSSKSDAEGAEENTNLLILPTFSYFVANNIAIGTGLGYTSSKDASDDKLSGVIIYPYGRYYKSLSEQFKFFGELGVPLSFQKAESAGGVDEGKSTSIGVSLSPGFAFFPTKRVAIELAFNGISYENETFKNSDGDKVKGAGGSSFSIGTNFFTPQIGVQFHF